MEINFEAKGDDQQIDNPLITGNSAAMATKITEPQMNKAGASEESEQTESSKASENDIEITTKLSAGRTLFEKLSDTILRRKSVDSQPDRSSYSSALTSNPDSGPSDGQLSPKDSLSELSPKLKTVASILSYHSFRQDSRTEQRANVYVFDDVEDRSKVGLTIETQNPIRDSLNSSEENAIKENYATLINYTIDGQVIENPSGLQENIYLDVSPKLGANQYDFTDEGSTSKLIRVDPLVCWELTNTNKKSDDDFQMGFVSESVELNQEQLGECMNSKRVELTGNILEKPALDQQSVKYIFSKSEEVEVQDAQNKNDDEGIICGKNEIICSFKNSRSKANRELNVEKMDGTKLEDKDLANKNNLESAEQAQLKENGPSTNRKELAQEEIGIDSQLKEGNIPNANSPLIVLANDDPKNILLLDQRVRDLDNSLQISLGVDFTMQTVHSDSQSNKKDIEVQISSTKIRHVTAKHSDSELRKNCNDHQTFEEKTGISNLCFEFENNLCPQQNLLDSEKIKNMHTDLALSQQMNGAQFSKEEDKINRESQRIGPNNHKKSSTEIIQDAFEKNDTPDLELGTNGNKFQSNDFEIYVKCSDIRCDEQNMNTYAPTSGQNCIKPDCVHEKEIVSDFNDSQNVDDRDCHKNSRFETVYHQTSKQKSSSFSELCGLTCTNSATEESLQTFDQISDAVAENQELKPQDSSTQNEEDLSVRDGNDLISESDVKNTSVLDHFLNDTETPLLKAESPNSVDPCHDDWTKILRFVELNLTEAKKLYEIIQSEEKSTGEIAQQSLYMSQAEQNSPNNNLNERRETDDDRPVDLIVMGQSKSQPKEYNSGYTKVVKFRETAILENPKTLSKDLSIRKIRSKEVNQSNFEDEDPMQHSIFKNKCVGKQDKKKEGFEDSLSYTNSQTFRGVTGPYLETQTSDTRDKISLECKKDKPHTLLIQETDSESSACMPRNTSFGKNSFISDAETPIGWVEDTRKIIEKKSEVGKLQRASTSFAQETISCKNARERYSQLIKSDQPQGKSEKNDRLRVRLSTSLMHVKDAMNASNLDYNDALIDDQDDFEETKSGNLNFKSAERLHASKSDTTNKLVGTSRAIGRDLSFGHLSGNPSALTPAVSEQGEHFISFLPETTPSGSTMSHVEQKSLKNSENLWKRYRNEQRTKTIHQALIENTECTRENILPDNTDRMPKKNSENDVGSSFLVSQTVDRLLTNSTSDISEEKIKKSSDFTRLEGNPSGIHESKDSKRNVKMSADVKSEAPSFVKSSLKFNSKGSSSSLSSKKSWKSEQNGNEYRETLSKNDLLNNDSPAPNEILKAIATNRTMSMKGKSALAIDLPTPSNERVCEELEFKITDEFSTKNGTYSSVEVLSSFAKPSQSLKIEKESKRLVESSLCKNSNGLPKNDTVISEDHHVTLLMNTVCGTARQEFGSGPCSKKVSSCRSYASSQKCDLKTFGVKGINCRESNSSSDKSQEISGGSEEPPDKAVEVDAKNNTEEANKSKEFMILCQYYSLVQSSEPPNCEDENTKKEPNDESLEAQVHVRLSPAITNLLSHQNLTESSLISGVETVTITSHASLPRWSRLNLIATCAEFCRICHETGGTEEFISPCQCRGSLSRVHRFCLEKWLAESDTSVCELCGHKYRIVRVPRYSIVSSVSRYLSSQENERSVRELFFDMVALCAFTPMIIGGSYFGLLVAETVYQRMLSSTISRAASFTLVSMMTTLDLAFLSWFALRAQHHTMQWYGWWRRNCDVKIVLPKQQAPNKKEQLLNQSP